MLRVEIEWVDSGTFYSGSWANSEQIKSHTQIGTVKTAGYLMSEDEETVYIANSYDPDQERFFGVQLIKRDAITGYTLLRARREIDGKKGFISSFEREEAESEESLHDVPDSRSSVSVI